METDKQKMGEERTSMVVKRKTVWKLGELKKYPHETNEKVLIRLIKNDLNKQEVKQNGRN